MAWVLFGLRLLVGLGVLGAALAVVRPATPRAGYALAGAAGVDLLFSCCLRGSYASVDYETMGDSIQMAYAGLACFGGVQGLLSSVLLVAALALGAREVKATKQA